MTYSIAIKLGSSNTSIFKQGEGIVLFEPSLVAYSGSGKERIIHAVGLRAKKMLGRTDAQTIVESPIVAGKIADMSLAEVMLKSYLNKVIGRGLVKPKIKAVLCVPLGLDIKDRKNYEALCYNCGIQDVVMVPAVVCGAIGYGMKIDYPQGLCLVNIGGGSTDIAVVSMNAIVAGVNVGIGGADLDKAIERCLRDKFNLAIGKGLAEKIKEEIGSLYKSDAGKIEVAGLDVDTRAPRTVVVESSNVYEAIEKYYSKIAEGIRVVLEMCPPNIVEDVTNGGVYFMGGTSLITGAEQYFKNKTWLNAKIADHTTAIDCIGAGKLLSDQKTLDSIAKI